MGITADETSTTKQARDSQISFAVIETPNIDTMCFRGVAPLADLARISQADIFDQVANPEGLQRDLSPKHASEAYQYVTRAERKGHPRAFPEVILNVRDLSVLTDEHMNTGRQRQIVGHEFTFDLNKINKLVAKGKTAVSRVDGNHRLFYAAGSDRRPPANVLVPFQIHVGLTPEQEAALFVDVNANQKGLNSSHLHVLRGRLTPEEQELVSHPERVFATWLSEDEDSPWNGLIYMGGSRKGSREMNAQRPVSFVTLEQGIRRILSKSQNIHDLANPQAQYILIRNYWSAVASVFQKEWKDYKDYLLVKNIGVMSMSIVGGSVIDRCMSRGEVEPQDMARYLIQVRDVIDWAKDATGERSVTGKSGNRAALLIAGAIINQLHDPGNESPTMQFLQDRLLATSKVPQAVANTPETVASSDGEDDDEFEDAREPSARELVAAA